MTRTNNRLQIDADRQISLRDSIAEAVADQIDLGEAEQVIEAAIAAIGAAAIFAALLPDGPRQHLVATMATRFERVVAARCSELASGAFDERMERRQ